MATLDDLSLPFFQSILPFLTFGDALPPACAPTAPPPPTFASRLTTHGFVRLLPAQVWGSEAVPHAHLRALSQGVSCLAELGLPLSLLSVCHEAQALARELQRLLRAGLQASEGCAGAAAHECIGDWAFFHVDAARGGKGWPPHRDRARLAGALGPSGTPAYITCWMPLSSATPESSCLYFVPRAADPGYAQEGAEEGEGEGENESESPGQAAPRALPPAHPLAAAFTDPSCWQNIIGLPTARGGLVCFSSRALHWGGAPLASEAEWEAAEGPRAPRQALSIAFAQPAYERPALARPRACAAPTFEEALALAACQALLYHAQAPLDARAARALWAVAQRATAAGLLDPAYAARVERAGSWVAFSTGFGESCGGAGAGAPTALQAALAFAGRAGVDAGFDASRYV